MSDAIKQKRLNSELTMLEKLPEGYKVSMQKEKEVTRIYLEIDRNVIQSELLPRDIKVYRFSIILDQDFPFKGPQVVCNTNFTQTSLCDQRDLFENIVGTRWIPSNTLYEISKLIPEFISEVIIAEASEQRKFVGRFHLGNMYRVEEYFGVFDVWKFKDVTNLFIDYSKPMPPAEEINQTRYLVVTDTGLLVGEPISQGSKVIYCRGWNTLYRLHKVRREIKESPRTITFVWEDDTHTEWVLELQDVDSFIQHITFRMESLGVECEKKQYKKKLILDTEVTKAAIEKDIDGKSKEVIDLIAIYEDILNDDLTIDNINSLIALYQKAIEYFSAVDSGRFEDFLNRNKNLLAREDVQAVLSSMAEPAQEEAKEPKASEKVNSLDPQFEHQKNLVNKLKDQEVFKIESDDEDSHKSLEPSPEKPSEEVKEEVKVEEIVQPPPVEELVEPSEAKPVEKAADGSDEDKNVHVPIDLGAESDDEENETFEQLDAPPPKQTAKRTEVKEKPVEEPAAASDEVKAQTAPVNDPFTIDDSD